jgi:metallo-beta-lactamase family protein
MKADASRSQHGARRKTPARREPRKRATAETARLRALGAAGTVTGSRFLLEHDGASLLVDCGLYQGLKALRARNWKPPTYPVSKIDSIVLTHAHIDHSGYLPRIYRLGYQHSTYVTPGTAALLEILLPDAGHLQEEEASYANRKHYSKHRPALPLFTVEDAHLALDGLRRVPYQTPFHPSRGFDVSFFPAGHLLGSSSVLVSWGDAGRRRTALFSGDVGRYGNAFMADPQPPQTAIDYLIIESTYGDRRHSVDDPSEQLAAVVNDTVERGGVLVVPAFAAGRTQEMLFYLSQLERERAIPVLPVFVDSPMAVSASETYSAYREDLNFAWDDQLNRLATADTTFVRSVQQSKRLQELEGPAIIMSASGMATGGRVLHHLARRLGEPQNTVLFTGFQVDGTRGRKLIEGAETIRLLGQDFPVRCRIADLEGMSAHADRDQLLRWAKSLAVTPRRTFVVHGEPIPAAELARTLTEELGHHAEVPAIDAVIDLD